MAERNTGNRSTVSVLAGIKCTADDSGTMLQATDLKTAITCRADGVTVQEPGEVVFPIKVVGELFKKAPSSSFTIEINEGRAEISTDRSRYTFTTYPVDEFPRLPSSGNADLFCHTTAESLLRLLDEGTFAGSPAEEFPQYLSSALFELSEGRMKTVATDGRRLSLSQVEVEESARDGQMLLPLTGLRELARVLSAVDGTSPVHVMVDDSQAYFQVDGTEFAVRRVESRFPPYEKILSPSRTTWMTVGRSELVAVLERVDVVVRDFSRMVVLTLAPGGDLKVVGRAPDIGEAIENLGGDIDGEHLRITFNIKYLLDGLRALHGDLVRLDFNGPHGQMTMSRPDEESFVYVLMPITLPDGEVVEADAVER